MTRMIRTLLFALAVLTLSAAASAQVRITVAFGPPAIPIYEQPLCPGDGYLWTPGYWAWDDDDGDYYWVPGTWVLAPEIGFLWTPPYWAWTDGAFVFYDGYWGPHVGFYGGIVYGFGYFGFGFVGGRWDGDRFFYNRAVLNVNETVVRNVYVENVNIRNETRISYNGGPGGVQARPRPEDEIAARERHLPPAPAQTQHFQAARQNRELHASANQGKPPVAATARPADFHAAVPAKAAGAPYHPPVNRGGGQPRAGGGAPRGENATPRTYTHPNELPPMERPPAPNTGDPNRDRKYQQQQQKLMDKQMQERQKLQQQQEREHAQMTSQHADEARRQQVEQRHQQQTQQMQERHASQMQSLQSRQSPPPPRQKH